MEFLEFGKNCASVSKIGIGCMRIAAMSVREVYALVRTAMDEGINFFDKAAGNKLP